MLSFFWCHPGEVERSHKWSEGTPFCGYRGIISCQGSKRSLKSFVATPPPLLYAACRFF